MPYLLLILGALGAAGLVCWWQLRRRGLGRWLLPYLAAAPRRRAPRPGDDVHVLLCFADHFEPNAGGATREVAQSRVTKWVDEYPKRFAPFRDSDGRPPRYTFFYPIEEYEPEHLDALAELCRAGFSEVELHLHHEGDTAESLRQQLTTFKELFAERHGLLSRRRDNGALAYGFIHGNWALCNSRPDGKCCGVNNELDVLRETGCYADFTMPSAPHVTQTAKINSIYYARNQPGRPRSHDAGRDAGLDVPPDDALLLIQGPLLLDWSRRKWGLLPRLENGCVQGSQPASLERLKSWIKTRVQVPARPDWFFVKLHAHGAVEESHEVLLGDAMARFHQELAEEARTRLNFHYHYVTARELYNLVKAAEGGWTGSVAEARDFELIWNGASRRTTLDARAAVPRGVRR